MASFPLLKYISHQKWPFFPRYKENTKITNLHNHPTRSPTPSQMTLRNVMDLLHIFLQRVPTRRLSFTTLLEIQLQISNASSLVCINLTV